MLPNWHKRSSALSVAIRLKSRPIAKSLSDELDQADQQKDREKTEELSQKIDELQKKLGPEYLALLKATEHVDPNSKDGQEIVSTFVKLDNSCGQR
jgi:flagellar motility protein MotE (MotC chaperone)